MRANSLALRLTARLRPISRKRVALRHNSAYEKGNDRATARLPVFVPAIKRRFRFQFIARGKPWNTHSLRFILYRPSCRLGSVKGRKIILFLRNKPISVVIDRTTTFYVLGKGRENSHRDFLSRGMKIYLSTTHSSKRRSTVRIRIKRKRSIERKHTVYSSFDNTACLFLASSISTPFDETLIFNKMPFHELALKFQRYITNLLKLFSFLIHLATDTFRFYFPATKFLFIGEY